MRDTSTVHLYHAFVYSALYNENRNSRLAEKGAMNAANRARNALTEEQWRQFESEGYLIVSMVFSMDEVEEIRTTFHEISKMTVPGHFEPDWLDRTGDPHKRYPLVMHPHRFHPVAMKYMLHSGAFAILQDQYGEEALAAQSKRRRNACL